MQNISCYESVLFCRKTLDKGALLYIHINLAIALLAALVIFVAGIETAKSINVSSYSTTYFIHVIFPNCTQTLVIPHNGD